MAGADGGLDYAARTEWLRGEGPLSDVVISSRVRLARNISGLPFPSRCQRLDRLHSLDMARGSLESADIGPRLAWIELHRATALERTLLVERHLISKQHSRGRVGAVASHEDPRGVAVGLPDERVSVMVNEEDHLRVQVVRSGFQLAELWEQATGIDDRIEASGLRFAFNRRFGYLTACPTNVGTGLRMSVMMHLPALKLTGDLEKVKRAASDMNLAVRGFYGEGSEAAGDFYQFSNQTTLGKSEVAILRELEQIIPQIVEYERVARRGMLSKRSAVLEDCAWRALGTLSSARLISAEEAMQLLSHLRLGVISGVLTHVEHATVNDLMLQIQPGHLQKFMEKELDQEARRAARSELLRRRLKL